MWQSVINWSLVFRRWSLADYSILFVGGLKDSPFRKDPDHLAAILGCQGRSGQRLCGLRRQIPYGFCQRFIYYLSGEQLGAPFTNIGAGFTAVIATRESAIWPFERFITTAIPASG